MTPAFPSPGPAPSRFFCAIHPLNHVLKRPRIDRHRTTTLQTAFPRRSRSTHTRTTIIIRRGSTAYIQDGNKIQRVPIVTVHTHSPVIRNVINIIAETIAYARAFVIGIGSVGVLEAIDQHFSGVGGGRCSLLGKTTEIRVGEARDASGTR